MKPVILLIFALAGCSDIPKPQAANQSVPEKASQPGKDDVHPPSDLQDAPPKNASFKVDPEQSVNLSGAILIAKKDKKKAGGDILLQVLKAPEGEAPTLLHSETLSGIGPFSLKSPQGLGDVVIVAFLDRTKNGPTEDDLGARLDLEIKNDDLEQLSLELGFIEKLGNLVPGRPLPGSGEHDADVNPDDPSSSPPNPNDNPSGEQAPNDHPPNDNPPPPEKG